MPRPMRTWVRANTLTEAGADLLRRMRAWLPGRAGDGPAPQRQAAAGAADVIRQDERERVLAQARVRDMVSIQMRALMQGNLGKREGLRLQLTERQATSELPAAWLRLRIEGAGPAHHPARRGGGLAPARKLPPTATQRRPTDRSSDFTQHRPHRSQRCNSAGKPARRDSHDG